MKNILLFFLIALLMDGVFGESVSVTERDSVTLHTGLSEIQENDVIQWRFKTDLIAQFNTVNKKISLYDDVLNGRFKDSLKLDSQTGDLTIRNIRTEHTGDYEVKNLNTLKTSFRVSVVPAVVSAAAVKSVMVGDSVTLQTGLTEIQRDDVILWRYGQQKSLVAKINRAAGIFNTFDGPDERFRDGLDLNNQTGSLIITNTRTEDTGVYEVEISSSISRYTTHHTQSFSVTVRDAVKSLSVKEGGTVTLPITELQNDDQILWMFEDIVIAEIHKAAQRFFTYNGPDERFRDRLELDHQTGSLIITNTRSTDSGLYKLKISTSRDIINQRFFVLVTAVPGPGLSPGEIAGICVGVGGVCFLLGAVAVVIYYCYKRSRVIRQNHALNGKQNPDDHVNEGTELTNAS